MSKRYQKIFIFFYFCNFFNISISKAFNVDEGKILFSQNCIACHLNGINVILPEKNLKFESLKANGMDNFKSIEYQIRNGKNGMPAFGGRLKTEEIEKLAVYVIQASQSNFDE
jgi:cytochrome c6